MLPVIISAVALIALVSLTVAYFVFQDRKASNPDGGRQVPVLSTLTPKIVGRAISTPHHIHEYEEASTPVATAQFMSHETPSAKGIPSIVVEVPEANPAYDSDDDDEDVLGYRLSENRYLEHETPTGRVNPFHPSANFLPPVTSTEYYGHRVERKADGKRVIGGIPFEQEGLASCSKCFLWPPMQDLTLCYWCNRKSEIRATAVSCQA